jgi:hypothetical protein
LVGETSSRVGTLILIILILLAPKAMKGTAG